MTLPTAAELRFTIDDARLAWDGKFNCGPGALCAVLNMTPDELRPHMLDFEAKGYTNPTLMADVLRGLGVRFRRVYECALPVDSRPRVDEWPNFGLVRIQWGGPWTKAGVPIRARYRKTHWIAVRHTADMREVFDVNALHAGGWILRETWEESLVPWILKHLVPKADGSYWPTHCWEILR